jgi:hypothetical protein
MRYALGSPVMRASALQVATKSIKMLIDDSIREPRQAKCSWSGYSREKNYLKEESRNQIADVMFLQIRLLIEVEMKTPSNLHCTGACFLFRQLADSLFLNK